MEVRRAGQTAKKTGREQVGELRLGHARLFIALRLKVGVLTLDDHGALVQRISGRVAVASDHDLLGDIDPPHGDIVQEVPAPGKCRICTLLRDQGIPRRVPPEIATPQGHVLIALCGFEDAGVEVGVGEAGRGRVCQYLHAAGVVEDNQNIRWRRIGDERRNRRIISY